MTTNYPTSKQTLPDETATTPVVYTKQNILYDTVEAIQDYAGYTGDLASDTGSLTAQIKRLREIGAHSRATVASAATLELPQAATVVVTGTTTITHINTPGNTGRIVVLEIQGACQVTDGDNLDLVGNFVGPGQLLLECDGTNWHEIARSSQASTAILVQEEGTDLAIRRKINFRGALVTASDDPANDRINVDILGGAGGHIIQDEGVDLASRTKLNFTGAAVTAADDAPNNATRVTINGGVSVKDEGTSVAFATTLDFVGPGVTATDAGSGTVSVTIPGPAVQDEGVDLPNRAKLNFTGPGVAVTDDAANNRSIITITSGGSAHVIQDEGTGLAQRTKLNFVGAGVTASDDAPNDATVVTISGVPQGAAGGDLEGTYPNPTVKAFLPRKMAINKTSAPSTSAALEIAGTDGALLVPRLTTVQRDALTPENGMIIYNTTTAQFERYQAGAWGAFGGGGGNTIVVQDEGTGLGSFSTLNFTGAGVTASNAGAGVATINIPGGGGGGGGASLFDILKLHGGG